ncbi:MAG: DUF3298 domain-containing protein [Phaeodactylibacter sp.]|nr:DUF3298 domain-containing protein [Phaeodactylibacter sp.]
MKKPEIFFIFLSLLLAAGCGPGNNKGNSDPKTDGEPAATALVFEQERFSRQSASCEQDSNRCARVSAVYPLAVAGPEEAARSINDSLLAYVKVSLAVFSPSPEDIPQSLDAIADDFLEEYEAVMSEAGEQEGSWSVELEGSVLYQSGRLAAVRLGTFSYAGGAHPNSFEYLLNFDARTGKVLRLPDLVRDTARLKELAELAFRQARELGPDENLSEAGFFWEGPFALPENYAMTEEGLYFVYNPYEVAAYAMGPTEFTLSREELAGILNEF